MTKRAIAPIFALIALVTCVAPASARSSKSKRHLKLWDRVLMGRYKQTEKLVREARKHSTRGRFRKAEALLRRAIKIRPYAAKLRYLLGSVHLFAGSYRGCVKALKEARKLDKTFNKNLVAFRLGLCLSMSGSIREGISEYLKVHASRWVSTSLLYWNLADSYMALGRPTRALSYYQAAVRSNPGLRVLHFAVAVAMDRAGQSRSADRQLRRANRLDPTGASLDDKDIVWLPSYDHLYYRALRAQSLHLRGKALQYWQRFMKAAPRSPWSYVVSRRVKALRLAPFEAKGISLDKGAADLKLVAAELTKLHGRLRRCLGTTQVPLKLSLMRGARLGLLLTRRSLSRVTVIGRFGAPGGGQVASCLGAPLRKVPWSRIIKGSSPVSLSFSLVGP